jgi:hypothetical protein
LCCLFCQTFTQNYYLNNNELEIVRKKNLLHSILVMLPSEFPTSSENFYLNHNLLPLEIEFLVVVQLSVLMIALL